MHAQRDSLRRRCSRDRQQLDDVTQLARELMSVGFKFVDSFDEDVALGDANVEGEAREDRQLLSRVAAGNIERRVRLGKAELLRLGQSLLIGPAVFGHLGEDEVAGAVDDADQRVDVVGDEALREGVDDRNPAAAACFKGDAGIVLAGQARTIRRRGRRAGFCWR